MIDPDGFRPNVAIVIMKAGQQVLWARRANNDGWQFPQGGMRSDETPMEAMYRELREETGLLRKHVEVLGSTPGWLRYRLPKRFQRTNSKPLCCPTRIKERIVGLRWVCLLIGSRQFVVEYGRVVERPLNRVSRSCYRPCNGLLACSSHYALPAQDIYAARIVADCDHTFKDGNPRFLTCYGDKELGALKPSIREGSIYFEGARVAADHKDRASKQIQPGRCRVLRFFEGYCGVLVKAKSSVVGKQYRRSAEFQRTDRFSDFEFIIWCCW